MMKGELPMASMMSLSWMVWSTRFCAMTSFFERTFMANVCFVSFLKTSQTWPKAPFPMMRMSSKSSTETLLVGWSAACPMVAKTRGGGGGGGAKGVMGRMSVKELQGAEQRKGVLAR